MSPVVLLFGHSYVRRLREDLAASDNGSLDLQIRSEAPAVNLGISPGKLNTYFVGRRGLTVPRAYDHFHWVRELQPDLVFLQIGENDLDNERESRQTAPHVLAGEIVELAGEVARISGGKVICGQLLPRVKPRSPSFNTDIHETNERLKDILGCDREARMWYRPHHGFWKEKSPTGLHAEDGVHLNVVGQKKLYYSVRSAVLKSGLL